MKKVFGIILTLLLVMQMVLTTPLSTFAASAAGYKDEEVNWMGNSSDYSKTLESVFDHGLRKVTVDGKYGLVDASGTFAAPPIYDEIQVRISEGYDDEYVQPAESIFVDGYVQAVRGGKMGLLNTSGEEVIPCKYDRVALPVEGVCRVIKKNKLGYWNLESNKEIVAPKYDLSPYNWLEESLGRTYQTIVRIGAHGKKIDTHPAWFDFNGGYALVPVSDAGKLGVNGQIIDKNGKEILSKAYPFRVELDLMVDSTVEEMNLQEYPQNGPYLVFQKYSTQRLTVVSDQHYKVAVPTHLNSGVVGPKGIIIPAKYHGYIGDPSGVSHSGMYIKGKPDPKGNPKDYRCVRYSYMTVFPEFSMAVTYDAPKNDSQNFETYGRLHSIVKFDGTVITNILNARYDAVNDVVIASDFNKNVTYVFYKNGTMKKYTDCAYVDPMINSNMKGYIMVDNRYAKGIPDNNQYLVSISSGKKSSSKFCHIFEFLSAAGTFWAANSSYKYGLVRAKDGKKLTSFAYEVVDATHVGAGQDQTTIVKKNDKYGVIDQNGKLTVPCKYEYISYISDTTCEFYKSIDYSYGVLESATGKILIPSLKDSNDTYYDNNVIVKNSGSRAVTLDDVDGDERLLPLYDCINFYKLTDSDGNELTDEYERISEQQNGMFRLDVPVKTKGDDGKTSQLVGVDGKPLCPASLVDDTLEGKVTFVVANGKFGCVSTSALAYSNN